ncbi:MAG: cob(I)yrinic acid a,c-diamide adenosyltransferase [Peptococcaceae bacterium]|nr:cob(I)yrinic acid a,c-diamide adenosyltransferase [Peptococcaceae bacterium]
MKKGLIHIYCGDGKGKTTAALGLAIRAAGRGFRVFIIQFLKDQKTGELVSLAKIPEIKIMRGENFQAAFSWQMTEEQKQQCRLHHDKMLKQGIAAARNGEVDLLILDEAIAAYNLKLVDSKLLLEFLNTKPEALEVVLTGRDPAPELVELADYVSEVKKIKHPFDRGVKARKGIEN